MAHFAAKHAIKGETAPVEQPAAESSRQGGYAAGLTFSPKGTAKEATHVSETTQDQPHPHPTPRLNQKKVDGCRSLLHDKNSPASLRSDGDRHHSEQ